MKGSLLIKNHLAPSELRGEVQSIIHPDTTPGPGGDSPGGEEAGGWVRAPDRAGDGCPGAAGPWGTSEGSLVNLATVVMLRATEDWAFRRYLDIVPLWAAEEKPTKIAT